MAKRITVYLSPEAIDALRHILTHNPSFSLSRHIRAQVCEKAGFEAEDIPTRGKKMAPHASERTKLYFDETSQKALEHLKHQPGGFSLRQYVNYELLRLSRETTHY